MPSLVATEGALGAGGALFTSGSTPATAAATVATNFTVDGLPVILVGDVALCPEDDEESVILTGSLVVTVGGIPIAVVGSQTSCGHPIVSSPNTILLA